MKRVNYLIEKCFALALLCSLVLLLFMGYSSIWGQTIPVLGQPFPDFTLTSFTGESITLSELQGKNVMLVFLRGKFRNGWCRACHYQYADLARLQAEQDILNKYNLEIIFVLPYTMEEVKHWTTIFPSQMGIIERWKNPTEAQRSNTGFMEFYETVKVAFPIDFKFDEENPAPLPFHVLADEDHKFSTSIGLFTTLWDGVYFEQNQPTTFILDTDGNVNFKYKSQVTLDRVPADYLIEYIDKVMVN
ncbi:peroxiredoxin family protein [Bacteroidota bacterium]